VKRIAKILGILLGVLLFLMLLTGILLNESLPIGKQGPQADALAHKMLNALNYKTYQKTRFLEWSFRNDTHHYKWDKNTNEVVVAWEDNRVILNLSDLTQSASFITGKRLQGEESTNLIVKALDKFNNDSFWLVAPYKVFDKGVSRSIVELSGAKALLVTYTKGGSTPGDSYLWLLNANGFPNAYKMWVGIIPVGGLKASWDDWMVTESGAFLPKSHQFGPLTLAMGNVKGYN